MTLVDQAVQIARASREVAAMTFAQRGAYGGYLHADLQVDEAVLTDAVDVYDNGTLPYHRPLPSETHSEMFNRPGRVSINMLKQWIRTWTDAYRSEVARTFYENGVRLDREDSRVTAIQRYYRFAQVDAVMEQVDALMRLTGNVVIRPWYDVAHDELVFHVYHGGQVRIVANPDNPRKPLATILMGSDVVRNDRAEAERVPTAEIFTDDRYVRVYGGDVVANEMLSTRQPPLVHCFNEAPINSWRTQAQGPALAELAVTIDSDMVSLRNYATIMQGHGVMVVKGLEDQQNFVSSPGAALKLGEEGDLYFASPGSPLIDWNATIIELVDQAREAAGIPKTMLDATGAASGAAIIEANGPVAELRQARLKLFRIYETHLIRASLDVLSSANAPGIEIGDPLQWDVSAKFGATSASYGVGEEIARDQHLLNLGVLTTEEILMREFPDEYDTLEEARAELTARLGIQAGEESENMETEDGREIGGAVGASDGSGRDSGGVRDPVE